MKLVDMTWGIAPWWSAVRWWWKRDRRRALRVFFADAVPAALWSIRHRGWEATHPVDPKGR